MDDQTRAYILEKSEEFIVSCPWFSLRKASRVATQLSNDMLQASGLLITQLCVLVVVATSETGLINHLAEDLVMDPTTLNRNLKPLERDGLVEIGQGEEDRRTRVVRLTEQGEEKLAEALPLWEVAKAELSALFGEQHVATLLEMVSLVSDFSPER